MSSKMTEMDDRLYAYMQKVSLREPDMLARLRQETAALGHVSVMQISPEQGQFMALLVELMGARNILEVGTFTGYSTLSCALVLPPDGCITACDISEEWTRMAKRYWQEAGVDSKIRLCLGSAVETLENLLLQGQQDSFDMMFIDADKVNYGRYYELGLKLVRAGGLILVDNVLWGGAVADPQVHDADTEAIRQFNENLLKDARVSISLVPIADGLTLIRKQEG